MKNFGIGILLLLFFAQCKKSDDCSCKSDFCTEIFITLGVKVVDQHQQAVKLDSFQTVKSADNKIIRIQYDSMTHTAGNYPIISDAQLEKNNLCSEAYIFKGWIKDSLVVEKSFNIRNNCCHVEFTEPVEDIIINL